METIRPKETTYKFIDAKENESPFSPRSSSPNFFERRWKFPSTFRIHPRQLSTDVSPPVSLDTTRSLQLHFLVYVAYVRGIPSHDKSRVSYDTGAIKVALGRGVFRIESRKLSDCSTRSRITPLF